MLRNQKGFSLIELMVVVAIIGILSAVAVPQFQKFQRKAKQSEVKASLASFYTAQKVFRAETNSYYSNLWSIGFEPEGVIFYDIGFGYTFLGANVAGYDHSPRANHQYTSAISLCGSSFSAGLSQNCMYLNSSNNPRSGFSHFDATVTPVITQSAFTAIGVAHRNYLGGSTNDEWTVNHRKELINIQNGAL